MPFADMQSFVQELENHDQLRRISAEVNPVLELSEIAHRVMKSPCPEGAAGAPATDKRHGQWGGRALLFENVRGSQMPVLINAFGSYARMELALGCENLKELADRVRQMIKPQMPGTLLGKVKKIPDLMKLAGSGPKTVKTGICQEEVHTHNANLFDLPIIQCWPADGDLSSEPPDMDPPATPIREAEGAEGRTGRYITLAGIYTKDPDTGDYNVGMYRVQVPRAGFRP